MDSASILQHPRRNLGSRHRSQADRFVKLAKKDPERQDENLAGRSRMLSRRFCMILQMKEIGVA